MTVVFLDKVIATNKGALKALYGESVFENRILPQINSWVSVDLGKCIRSRIVYLDDADEMKSIGAPVVTDRADERQNKAAIDAIFDKLKPAFLTILGSIDIVPMQTLANPIYSPHPTGDHDRTVPSDLPYACGAPFGNRITAFLKPTRAVARLPGITGVRDPEALLTAIKVATILKGRSAEKYKEKYFSVSAEFWEGSTRSTLSNIVQNSAMLKLSPSDGPEWTQEQLAALTHFVNCHGSDNSPVWVGERRITIGGTEKRFFPKAVIAEKLDRKIDMGAIVAAECCYGGQLYDPRGQHAPICNTYLANGAAAFCGSSTIAYGQAVGQSAADYLTQHFMVNLLDGKTVGQAMELARQTFIAGNSMQGVNLKTIAQFSVFGDASVRPVAGTAASAKALATMSDDEFEVSQMLQLQEELVAEGLSLADRVAIALFDGTLAIDDIIIGQLEAMALSEGLTDIVRLSTEMEPPPIMAKSSSATVKEVYHHIFGAIDGDGEYGMAVLTVLERDNKLVSKEICYRK